MKISQITIRPLVLVVSYVLTAAPLLAQEHNSGYLPQFRMQIDEANKHALLGNGHYYQQEILYPELSSFEPYPSPSAQGTYLQQYDAQLYYPISNLHGMSLDLGVNIKYLNGVSRNLQKDGLISTHNFNEAIPMIHATALFELPFEGLSAGLEGSHLDYARTRAFDYKAKLKYNWSRGFGLEGGWQHQQYSLEQGQQESGLEYESKGVFLDLFMNF